MAPLTQHQQALELLDNYIALLEAELPPVKCPECKQGFSQKASLEAHQREELHASCYNCAVVFTTRELYTSHMQSHTPALVRPTLPTTQFRCCDCERDFKSESALADHLRRSGFHRPRKGSKNNKRGKKQNQTEEGSSQTACKQCGRTFKDRGALTQHLSSVRHHPERSSQTACKQCERTFRDRGALTQHLSSVRHHPLSDIKCLADGECKKRFNCPSGQLQHLESGKCSSGITKTRLDSAFIANDTTRIITSGGVTARWLVEDNLSSTSQTRSPILTPTSTEFLGSYPPSPILTPVSTLSTTIIFPRMLALSPRPQSGYQRCPLCPPSRTRKFKSKALQQHLSSGVHALVPSSLDVSNNISFHCPRSLMGEVSQERPLKHFSSVSGLAQHLESGACNGGKGTLRRVVEYVQDEMKGMGFGGLKLLS